MVWALAAEPDPRGLGDLGTNTTEIPKRDEELLGWAREISWRVKSSVHIALKIVG